jgi:hypothetical protein
MGQGDAQKPRETRPAQQPPINDNGPYRVQKILLDPPDRQTPPSHEQVLEQRPTGDGFSLGVTRKGDSYIIDAVKFKPHKFKDEDLPQLDPLLSGGIENFPYDTSHINTNGLEDISKLPSRTRKNMDEFAKTYSDTLQDACNRETYIEHPEEYKCILTLYHTIRLMKEMGKVTHENIDQHIADTRPVLEELIKFNQERFSSHFIINPEEMDWKLDHIDPETKFLFSKYKTESDIAEEIVVIRMYRNLLEKNGIDFPEMQEMVETDITKISSDQHHSSLQEIHGTNQVLGDIAKDMAQNMPEDRVKDSAKDTIRDSDLNSFQLALKNEIVATTNYRDWVKDWIRDYPHRFNSSEPWLQESMERLGIKEEDISKSYEAFLANKHVQEALLIKGSITDAAYNFSSEEALETYNGLVRANAKLKYIHSQLSKGFPVESIPEVINGRRHVITSGEDHNCAFHSFEQVSTDWDKTKIKEKGRGYRVRLIEKASERLNLLEKQLIPDMKNKKLKSQADNEALSLLQEERDRLKARIPNIKKGDLLELDSWEGRLIIDCLVEEGLPIDRSRGLLIYRLVKGRINCVESEIMPRSPEAQEPPYTFFLKQDVHFNAMVEKVDPTVSKTVDDVIKQMNALANEIRTYKKDHKNTLGEILSGKKMTWKDYENLDSIAKTLSQLQPESELPEEIIIDTSKQAIDFLKSINDAMQAKLKINTKHTEADDNI